MEDIKTRVRRFINENFVMGAKSVEFSDSDSFMDHHLVDSTGFLELVTFLEETYDISIEDQEMVPENLDSLESIERFLGTKLKA